MRLIWDAYALEQASRSRPARRVGHAVQVDGQKGFSSAVRSGIRLKNWKTKPMLRLVELEAAHDGEATLSDCMW